MTALLRAAQVIGRPVVTLSGDRLAEVKDVLFDRGSGELVGFTLRNPGFFGGSRKDAMPIAAIGGLGDAALMVASANDVVSADTLAAAHERAGGDVLSDRIVTDDGRDLGKVVDVIVDPTARPPDVVGYEVEGEDGRRVLIPLPATLSVSGQNLVVPAQVTDFLADDLATLSPAVEALRKRLATPGGPPTHISGATGD
ncbi:MAG: PRC-barrel domain-containing protein [Sporichthyaceae bacterium]